MKHALITPNANILIGANIVPQYEQTIKRELEADLPMDFVVGASTQKAYIDLANGTRILYRPFDDADKLRSLNLTMFVMVEASEVNAAIFHQLKTRLRNMSAASPRLDENYDQVFGIGDNGIEVPLYDADWRKGIIESNPDAGWVRTDVLLVSDDVQKHGHVVDNYTIGADEKDAAISSHIASTDVNRFLPPTFIAENTKNKPGWWVARFIYGSFTYAEGLVYPKAMDCIVQTFNPDPRWKRLCAFDYGLHDDAVFLFIAIDDDEGIAYVYREVRLKDENIDVLAQAFRESSADIPIGGWYSTPLIDPKSGAKRDYNKDSLTGLFLERGIAFQPGYVNIPARILRTNTYFESGKLKIMDCCRDLIGELREYKFQSRTLGKDVRDDKPEDKNNHGINPLEWMCMELPADPKDITYGVYNKFGIDITKEAEKHHWMPHALDDPEDTYDYANAAYNIKPFQHDF